MSGDFRFSKGLTHPLNAQRNFQEVLPLLGISVANVSGGRGVGGLDIFRAGTNPGNKGMRSIMETVGPVSMISTGVKVLTAHG